MSGDNALILLKSNSKEKCDETVRILLKIIDNIIQNPNNPKIRCLQKHNATINNKILQVKGGADCLKLVGFIEDSSSFSLPTSVPIDDLRKIKDTLQNLWTTPTPSTSKTLPETNHSNNNKFDDNLPDISKIKRFIAPPLKQDFGNDFLNRIELMFNNSLKFADKECQERAKKLIPLAELEKNAQETLRNLQEQIKKDKQPDPNVTLQDMLILELLTWFKEDFFSWVDKPNCIKCGGPTNMLQMSTNPSDLQFTNRVEIYNCLKCPNVLTKFPRYNDLNLLLETRRGRCGEWAQVFTLFCCALNWDARIVYDETDHVWTEVYSIGQQRWVHCDSCENACDAPLMYETGWNKKVSYIIAYSPDEVQDVTWRYTANFKETRKRRVLCKENELLNCIMRLRNERQENMSITKRNYLNKRIIWELCEFLTEKQAKKSEKQGRESGSAAWRSARGEINVKKDNLFVWSLNNCDIIDNKLTIKYSAANDAYDVVKGNGKVKVINGWENGVFSYSNVFKKEEKDWKTVYLCRNENTNKASIAWKIEIKKDAGKVFDKILLKFGRKTFEDGVIDVRISSDNLSVDVLKDSDVLEASFEGKTSIMLNVDMYGGKGDVAWQHTQLFRQDIDNDQFPFILSMTFKSI